MSPVANGEAFMLAVILGAIVLLATISFRLASIRELLQEIRDLLKTKG